MVKAQKRLTEESDILTALDNQQFSIWLQPQVATTTGKVCSAEVLLRQRQPDGSWALPNDLIDSIESCGLMVTVGHWVLEESCRQLAVWQSRGIMLPISVNISALQLLHHDMVSDMLALLNRYRIAPGTLILEVTESRRIDDPKAAVAILRPLRNAGVRIALDDFGMGYAGLRQLQHMKSVPVDILKIDKIFIDSLPEDTSMVAAIIQLGRSLNLKMVAEGVESKEQYAWLRAADVDILQGFLLRAPYQSTCLNKIIWVRTIHCFREIRVSDCACQLKVLTIKYQINVQIFRLCFLDVILCRQVKIIPTFPVAIA